MIDIKIEIVLPSNDSTIATADWIEMNSVLTLMDQNDPALNRVSCNPITFNILDIVDLTDELKKADFLASETRAEHDQMVE